MKKLWRIIASLLMFVCALTACACAQELVLPPALTSIGEEAFMRSAAFETAVLPEGLKRIESKAFAECTELRTLYMPSSVEYIAPDAFEGCEGLHFVCDAGCYAALYAQGTDFITFGPKEKIPVTISADVLLAQENTPITWTVHPAQWNAQDRYTLTVYLNGSVYSVYENLDPQQQSSVTATLENETGLVYALCSYVHAHGETTHALSETTQLAGELTATLLCGDPYAKQQEKLCWELTVQGAAGIPMAEYSVYRDGALHKVFEPENTTVCEVLASDSGVYRADAVITDGLGRSISITGSEVTVSDEISYVQEVSYSLSGDGTSYIVDSCPADATTVTIPDERNGIPVTAVADGAFMLCDDLLSVTLGSNVQSIGAYAFHGCSGLYNVTMPDSLAQIGEGAFSACTRLSGISLPSALEAVPDYMAEGSGLTAIALPANVTAVGKSAFADCAKLSSVTLNQGLASLGSNAFEYCTALTSIAFPESLTALGAEAFSGCTGLRELSIPQTLTHIGNRTFGGCTALRDLVLPAGVSSVGMSAFAGCENLNTITFENINASIGEDAFAYCGDVEVRTFGAGSIQSQLERMGVAFRNTAMVVLTKVECITPAPAAERTMRWQVEAGWGVAPYTYQYQVYCGDELQTTSEPTADSFFQHVPERGGDYYLRVTVSDSNGCVITRDSRMMAVAAAAEPTMEYLKYALNGEGTGYVITYLYLPQQETKVVIPAYIDGIPVVEIELSGWQTTNSQYLTEIVIPDTVTFIDLMNHFEGLKTLTLGSGLKTLDTYAFNGCTALETIHIPYGLTEIKEYAFQDCDSLKEITLPSSVTKLEGYVFRNCDNLSRATIPSSVTSCGSGIFNRCTQLQTVEWNAPLQTIPYDTFSGCTNLDTVTFGFPVRTIGSHSFQGSGIRHLEGDLSELSTIEEFAFQDCPRLESLALPAKKEKILFKSYSMRRCRKLQSVTLDADAALLAYEEAFLDCGSLRTLDCKAVKTNGESAFANCTSLSSVRLESTYRYAFDGCTALKKVTFVGNIGIDHHCFRNCTSLTTISYLQVWDGEKVSYPGFTIGGYAFQNCTSLASYSTPAEELAINEYAFQNCTSLTSFTFPAERNGSYVGEGAFLNCTALTSLNGLNYLDSIGDYAFKNCTALSSADCTPIVYDKWAYHNELTIGKQAFANCYNLTYAAFDEYTVEIGEDAFAGCSNLTVSTVPGSYAESYFATPVSGAVSAGSLPISASAEIEWGKNNPDGTAECFITLWNSKNGPVPAASSELFENSALQNLNVTIKVYDDRKHSVTLAEGYAFPVSIPYHESVTVKAFVKCIQADPSACKHSDYTFDVRMTADNISSYTKSFPIEATFPRQHDSDWYITEPTVITGRIEIGGNVYVEDALTIQGCMLDCAKNVFVRKGGTVKMTGSSMIQAQQVQVDNGGAIDMQSTAQIRADSLNNEGALSITSALNKITVEDFSVKGSGVLNFAEDGRITTDRFTFDSSSSHTALLTNGAIITRNAEIRRGFYASENQAFLLRGDECTLNVARTSPKQRFAGLTIDCRVEGLSVAGGGSLLGLPFECDRFVMTHSTLQEDIVNSDAVAKEIYDKTTAARLEAMTEEEKELADAMAGWYTATPDLAHSSIQNQKEMALASVYAQKAILGWVVEIAAGMSDEWSSVNDVLRSLLASGTHSVYTYEDKGVTYDVYVKPVGGLTTGAATATVGRITVITGGKEYEFVYSLNQHGIRHSAEWLLTVLRDYSHDQYTSALKKAVEEAIGKQNAKYAMGVVKVIETSLIEEKSLIEVIASKYGKTIAKELISRKYPKVKKLIQFYTKWDKYIKQNQKIEDMITDVRKGETLPTDLMKEFLNLRKVIPVT